MSMSNKLAKAGFRGDAYAYRGDPGLLGDIWKGIKSVGRVATGLVGQLGIPVVSGVARIAGTTLFGRAPIPGTTTYPLQPPAPMPPGVMAMPGGVQLQNVMESTECPPGTMRGPLGTCINLPMMGAPGMGMTRPGGPGGATMGGYHLNKTGYFLRDGSYVAPFSKWVKNRRRNPGNMKALSRSLGRIKSAKRMTQALSAITIRSSCPPSRSRSRSKH